MVKITEVDRHSLSRKKGIKPGDELVSINGNPVRDVLDYRFYLTDTVVTLELLRGGRTKTVKIKKGEYDDIGLGFETPLMDKKQRCSNKCVFCFIDQNPEGMRESIYFKDDDSRLSFIHGNYVTLTNMTDSDVDRIIKMRMSPINVSIHTTNPELRVRMMGNRFAGDVLSYLSRFRDAELSMCGQIVLCRGINDGDELRRSLADLAGYYPALTSVAVVPAGLTKHREGLYPLSDFTEDEAGAVIDTVEQAAMRHLEEHGTRLFYVADELYLKAKRPIPPAESYEEYPQLENGVGMLRLFSDEYGMAVERISELAIGSGGERTVTVVTAAAAFATVDGMAKRAEQLIPGLHVNVKRIVNRFFGESITVTGLLVGRDILAQLEGEELGDEVIIPANCLRYPEEDFLCGMTLEELRASLGVPVRVSSQDGYGFFFDLLGCEEDAGVD